MNSNKEKYKTFCDSNVSLPIFVKYWWLNAVAGNDNWDVLLYIVDKKIIASYPYYLKKKMLLFKILTIPRFTPFFGPYIVFPENIKHSEKLSLEKKVLFYFIENLPRTDYIQLTYHYSFSNWLPFFWKGFKQTTLYTYLLDSISDSKVVFENFDYSKKKQIKKAEKSIKIHFDLSAEDFYANHNLTLTKQNKNISYDFKLFKRIYDAAYLNESGRTLYAIDEFNNIHGALFIVWDNNSAYNLISSFDPYFKNSGASSLLVFAAIKFVADKTLRFDMEGSMNENVANSFRQFGALQTPYFYITRTTNLLLKFYFLISGNSKITE